MLSSTFCVSTSHACGLSYSRHRHVGFSDVFVYTASCLWNLHVSVVADQLGSKEIIREFPEEGLAKPCPPKKLMAKTGIDPSISLPFAIFFGVVCSRISAAASS